MSAARALVGASARLWPRVTAHPLVQAIADGSLDQAAFERWIVADYAFNVEYLRFGAGLTAIAPTPHTAEVVAAHLIPNQLSINLLRTTARRHNIDLDAEPGPTTLGFSSYLWALLARGYEPALAALYGAEKVYFDAWSAVGPFTSHTAPYWPLVENWSSEHSADALAALTLLVNAAAPDGPSRAMLTAFDRVVRFELLFWSAIYVGETW